MASASGCSDSCSREAAIFNSSCLSKSPAMISVTFGFPSVTVPVLSNTTVCTVCAISSASADLIRIPFSAPLPVPTMMAVGVASPRAQGQDMTSTAIPMDRANSKVAPVSNQMTADKSAMIMTTGTKMPLTLSASFAMGALDALASSTSRMICASVVSSPTLVARNRI